VIEFISGEYDAILFSGKEASIVAGGDDPHDNFIMAECELNELRGELAAPLPPGVHVQIFSEDGFGTSLFHFATLSGAENGMTLSFECVTPNEHWEGHYGLSTYISAVGDQVEHFEDWDIAELFIECESKGLTLTREIPFGESIHTRILAATAELRDILYAAEVALSGLPWKPTYQSDESAFCKELLHPLLRRMGFMFVRYTHGKREYGKDFTFSELNSFGDHRHYGLQAKAGDVSGGVNSAIDELLGQIKDAFEMPYYELGSKEQRFISTFIIAISGKFTENAREKIIEKMPTAYIGSVYFFDRDRISELVDQFWKIEHESRPGRYNPLPGYGLRT
jgi:hypothetical protein